MPGLYFEEFSLGQTFNHEVRRTVTETDNFVVFGTDSQSRSAAYR